ncbi:hypothetical protein HNY73_004177 [Argiope bruennichi]|uniref:Uncharacterized protein n=1 Tax=Argiope bruennichi TaxID=94029 RepID=A0A8T0FV11_ARGBR|nr:hypothetical protein HNY73_004177 [Argiope bruennichi]
MVIDKLDQEWSAFPPKGKRVWRVDRARTNGMIIRFDPPGQTVGIHTVYSPWEDIRHVPPPMPGHHWSTLRVRSGRWTHFKRATWFVISRNYFVKAQNMVVSLHG